MSHIILSVGDDKEKKCIERSMRFAAAIKSGFTLSKHERKLYNL